MKISIFFFNDQTLNFLQKIEKCFRLNIIVLLKRIKEIHVIRLLTKKI